MLVRVVPASETNNKSSKEEDFYDRYGDNNLGAEKVNRLYQIIKHDSNIDQKFE